MHRTTILGFALVAACAANSPTPLPSLTGTWQGQASNGFSTRYVFGADGSFEYDIVSTNSTEQIGAGTFTFGDDNDTPLLTLTGTFTNPEDSSQSNAALQSLAYVSGTSLCDVAYYPSAATPPSTSVVEAWSSSTTTWPIDANGNAGAQTPGGTTFAFADDGTFVVSDLSGGSESGTYTFANDVVTTTIQQNGFADVGSLTRVDGIELEGSTAVLCNPVFTLQ